AKPYLVEQRLHLLRNRAHVRPAYAWARIQIDPQFIRVLEISGTHGVGVLLDATEVDNPDKAGRIVNDDLFCGAARWKRQSDRSQPRRPFAGSALLIERFALGAIHEALENDRAVLDSAQRPRRNRQIVANQIEFRELRLLGKVGLRGIGHPNLASPDREHFDG